jgi:hypothetical protein
MPLPPVIAFQRHRAQNRAWRHNDFCVEVPRVRGSGPASSEVFQRGGAWPLNAAITPALRQWHRPKLDWFRSSNLLSLPVHLYFPSIPESTTTGDDSRQ